MKLFVKILITAVLTSLLFSACKKYEEGPAFSLRTKKNRICGDWTIGSVTLNGADVTATYQAFVTGWDIEKDGAYKITGVGSTDDGKWKLGEDKDDIMFTSNAAGAKEQSYRILRLKHKDMWLRQTQTNGDVIIVKLK